MPSIYLHRYPSHEHFQLLRGATELELLDMQFSRDGTVLLSLGSRPDFSLVLWDWRAGVPLLRSRFTYACSTLVLHPSDPLAFAAVGPTTLVFGKFDRELEHYFLNVVQAVPQVDGQEPEYSHCCWAQDPKYVYIHTHIHMHTYTHASCCEREYARTWCALGTFMWWSPARTWPL
jgi:hypothetical protein